MEIIENIRLRIDKEEVLRYLGCFKKEASDINPLIIKLTREEIAQAYSLIEPKGIYDFVKVKQFCLGSGKILLSNKQSLQFDNKLVEQLADIKYAVFCIVSVGHFLEDKISEYFSSGEAPKAMALDAAGTVAIRNFRDCMCKLIRQKAEDMGLKVIGSFSPGEEGWTIDQQKTIFQIIPADKIGVNITDSYMMVPKKSLSFMIGIGIKPKIFKNKENSCKTCKAVNCQFRKN
ncbi:MAG: vitamin B12 dependent-methionine synthase activation domain-containing protein [Atribacterota bacterium]|jgi:hypothetical protein|nr:vitamin B12 dependent-methionine synthase activation domain-containing protein [Atribacterota bacterium]MDD3641729.1 vitamin B12 dependent-methionine synthase activation domain-containing protein [Atribacterota bacterium]MDD4288935.1 vitamin B12 dependent-methionine synthase activation domain-containing protein [Atribacterota bacterium]MDD5635091.1 vitamin B12 dependent-methionine synthase activation domain-containing protein [Atribacterota bacterium]